MNKRETGLNLENSEINPKKKSLTEYILESRGFRTIEEATTSLNRGIPLEVAEDLILIDLFECDNDAKQKIFAYRIWTRDPNFETFKEYLPEGAIRLDDVLELLDDNGERRFTNERIADIDEIVNVFLTEGGGVFIKRYKLLAKIIKVKFEEGFTSDEILENRSEIMSELRRLERKRYLENEKNRNKERYYKKKREIDGVEKFLEGRIKFYPGGGINFEQILEEADIPVDTLKRTLKTRFSHDRRAEIILRQLNEENAERTYVFAELSREYRIKKNSFFVAKNKLMKEGIGIRTRKAVDEAKKALKAQIQKNGRLNSSLSEFANKSGLSEKAVFTAAGILKSEEPDIFSNPTTHSRLME